MIPFITPQRINQPAKYMAPPTGLRHADTLSQLLRFHSLDTVVLRFGNREQADAPSNELPEGLSIIPGGKPWQDATDPMSPGNLQFTRLLREEHPSHPYIHTLHCKDFSSAKQSSPSWQAWQRGEVQRSLDLALEESFKHFLPILDTLKGNRVPSIRICVYDPVQAARDGSKELWEWYFAVYKHMFAPRGEKMVMTTPKQLEALCRKEGLPFIRHDVALMPSGGLMLTEEKVENGVLRTLRQLYTKEELAHFPYGQTMQRILQELGEKYISEAEGNHP